METSVGASPGRRWRALTRGVHVLGAPEERLELLRAWQHALPDGAAFSHLTAAWVHGWWLPPLPRGLPVFAAVQRDHQVRRPGVRCSRHTEPLESATIAGLRVTTPRETLLTCASDLDVLDLVVLADGALECGVPPTALDISGVRRRRGLPALRQALALAHPRSESAWESVLRLLHHAAEVPVEPQHEIRDDRGEFVARADLWIVGTRTLQEYDGGVHRRPDQHRADLTRDRALARAGWRRNGYTAREVTRRPATVIADADEALGRAWDPMRLDSWERMLAASLFSPRAEWSAVGRLVR
ncbi:MAG: hypothetical protein Q8Q02_16600 [Nocardioides sp.]|nr:hypothetical protein [Nocardioides sp.]